VDIIIISWNLKCSCRDKAEKLLSWHSKEAMNTNFVAFGFDLTGA
jgi:hypothetical protein